MRKGMFMAGLCFWWPVLMMAQTESVDSGRIIEPEVSYTGEVFNNLTGGIKKGSAYLGMVNLRIAFSTGAAHLWKGGKFYFNGANTHGARPSADYLGDLQVASNIEAGNHTFVQELWYKQSWTSLEITGGLQDLNVDFINSSGCALFLNSSFGVMPTVSGNIPAPIFPLTSLGLSSKWDISAKYSLLMAIYDGSATNFKDNPHNLKWNLGKGEGVLFFGEIQHSVSPGSLPGTYKAGIYIHQHLFTEKEDYDGDIDTIFRNNNGIYIIGDQMIWEDKDSHRNLSAFIQMGLSPRKQNFNKYYIGTGLNYTGLFSRMGNDIAGLAIAHVGLRESVADETVLELTYQYTILHVLYLQPDMQYIIQPAGTGLKLKNSLSVTLRFGLNL